MSSDLCLGDIAEITMGQSPAGENCNSVGLGLPLLNGPTEFGTKHPYPVQFTTETKKLAKSGDLLFCVRGSTTGKMNWSDQTYVIGRGIASIRGKNGFPNSFIRAAIESNLDSLLVQATGSTFPNVSRDLIASLTIPKTSPEEAVEIASIIEPIDDRIALLRETNATLEAIAQAMFKSWFVDFDPVHANAKGRAPEGMSVATAALFPDSFEESELGLVPRGWRASTMDEVSVVGIGKTPPRKEPQWFSENAADVRWVSIRDMGVSGAFIYQTSEYLTAESIDRFNVRKVPNNTVLLSFKMTIGRVALTDGEMTTNEAIAHFKLEDQSPLTSEFIYLHLKQFDYSTLSSTSSIADAVNSKTVKAIPILVPDSAVVLAFQDSVRPIFARIKLIQQQAQTLATLRDTLLPRLISGQLRIENIEGVV